MILGLFSQTHLEDIFFANFLDASPPSQGDNKD